MIKNPTEPNIHPRYITIVNLQKPAIKRRWDGKIL